MGRLGSSARNASALADRTKITITNERLETTSNKLDLFFKLCYCVVSYGATVLVLVRTDAFGYYFHYYVFYSRTFTSSIITLLIRALSHLPLLRFLFTHFYLFNYYVFDSRTFTCSIITFSFQRTFTCSIVTFLIREILLVPLLRF